MEIDKIIDELIEMKIVDFENSNYIRAPRLKSVIFSKYNIELDLKDLVDYLKKNNNLVQIDTNFFVSKLKLEALLKDNSRSNYREVLESKYIIKIKEEYLLAINIGSERKSFDEVLKYGLDNYYVEEEWLKDMNIEESCFVDIYEVIEELQSRGIKIR